MSERMWRWEERDFGFRYRTGMGRRSHDHYQGRAVGEYYVLPGGQCKLENSQVDRLPDAPVPSDPTIIPNPWHFYDHDWDWIVTDDDICLNWAGCLDREEIDRREDLGVGRARVLVLQLAQIEPPAALNLGVVRNLHCALMGEIYPFAGEWRKVEMSKGDGPVKWPLPPGGIGPQMQGFAARVLSRSPFVSASDEEVFAFAAEVMGELLAIHPFREGNGRLAFQIGNLVLMQNALLPIGPYDCADEARYFAACERSRIQCDHAPLAALLREWADKARERWEVGDER
jgi:fido (protein-threonine AMPylation protein)